MKKKVAIIDYGLGNIVSAQQSFIKDAKENNLNVDVVITNKVEIINDSTHIVLPGQGAFKSCIDGLRSIEGMIDSLNNNVLTKKNHFWVYVLVCSFLPRKEEKMEPTMVWGGSKALQRN